MKLFGTAVVTPRVTRLTAPCGEMMYLVEGEERAALVDSGMGFGSLLTAVRELTPKPVALLLTHGHVDHAMGAGEFEEVWMSPLDREVFRRCGGEAFRREAAAELPGGAAALRAGMIPTADPERFRPLTEGDRFDLGGVTLTAFSCPGHTPGSTVLLCPEERLLFSGDAFSDSTFLLDPESLTVEGYLSRLLALAPRLTGRFDRVLEAHTTGELPREIIDGVIRVCREVLAGVDEKVLCEFGRFSGLFAHYQDPVTLRRVDGGVGNLLYDKARLRGKASGDADSVPASSGVM